MHIFSETNLSGYLRNREEETKQAIEVALEGDILGTDTARYVENLVERYRLNQIVFHWGRVETSSREEMVSATRMAGYFGGHPGKRVQVQVLTFHIPYEGEPELLRCQPSQGILWTLEVTHQVGSKEISFDVYNDEDNIERVKVNATGEMGNIRTQANNVNREVEQFNARLPSMITEAVQRRQERLQKQSDTMKAIGFPIRKKG